MRVKIEFSVLGKYTYRSSVKLDKNLNAQRYLKAGALKEIYSKTYEINLPHSSMSLSSDFVDFARSNKIVRSILHARMSLMEMSQ